MAQLGQDFSKITTSCLDDYVGDAQSDNCYYDVDELISYFKEAM